MGAVTALLHGDRDPSIAGMVIDSPFSNLKKLCMELAKTYTRVPGFVLSMAQSFIRKTIKKKAGFDLNHLNPMEHVDRCFIPAFFAAARDDTFILPQHTQDLFEKYAGDKQNLMMEGDHNSQREQFFLDRVSIFFYNTLQCQDLPEAPKSVKKSSQRFRDPQAFMTEEEMVKMAIEASLRES